MTEIVDTVWKSNNAAVALRVYPTSSISLGRQVLSKNDGSGL